MIRRYILLYFIILTIPLFLGLTVGQSIRCAELIRDIHRLEAAQEEWIESNKRLIAGIAVLSSAERVEYIAQNDLGLSKKTPEDVVQVRIERGRDADG
jgi:cell division protein FtsL